MSLKPFTKQFGKFSSQVFVRDSHINGIMSAVNSKREYKIVFRFTQNKLFLNNI